MIERDVIVREEGLRDGIQSIAQFFPTETKKAWISAAAKAGIPEIQATSFVRESVIPQFADADEIAQHALSIDGLVVSALVPNRRGAERAFRAGVHVLGYVISVSESHNLQNVRRRVADSLAECAEVCALRKAHPEWQGVKLSGGVSTAYGCSIEGKVSPVAVLRLVEDYLELGMDLIVISDTVGYANPAQVRTILGEVQSLCGEVPVVAHFHDTRGLGLANVYAALESGVREFDACLGGLGGCPFAPGATGNIVMEDLVFLLEAQGLRTGVEIDGLMGIRSLVAEALPDETLHSHLAQAGLPKNFTPATAT